MGVSGVFACVRVLSEDVAKLPLILYRRTPEGGKERAVDSPLYHLIHSEPNEYQTAFEFREMMQAHLALRGNAYAYVNRVRGEIREILPIHPDCITPKIDSNWRVTYEVRYGRRGYKETYRADRILHLRGLATDGVVGLSPVALAKRAINLAMRAEKHGDLFYSNGGQPGLIVKHQDVLSDEGAEHLQESIQRATSGENLFKVLLLEDGLEPTVVSLNHSDAQFIESRQFQLPEIARFYRMPLHKIQDLTRSTNNNIEHQGLEYLTDTLQPWLARWEQRASKTLLTRKTRETLFFEFISDAVHRGDLKTRYDAYSRAINDGWMNPNEARVKENLNPVEGLNEYRRPMNTEPVGEPAAQNEG